MLNFKEFLENDGSNIAYMASDMAGSEAPPKMDGNPLFLSSLNAILPNVVKTSQIKILERNKNPIFLMLADGTKLFLTWDEFKRIPGPEPTVGKTLTVVFQRNPDDKSETPSKINSILCH